MSLKKPPMEKHNSCDILGFIPETAVWTVELANHIDRKLSLHVGNDFKSLSVWDPQTFSGPAVIIYLFIYLCTIAKCPSRGL